MAEARLSLVIPCYNESANLPLLAERCAALMEAAPVQPILVDNGSTDDSPQVLSDLIAGQPGIKSVRVPVNQGYGYGILEGLRAASTEWIGWTHADLQTDPMDAVAALEALDASSQQGDRGRVYVKGWRYGRPMADRIFTGGMSIFTSALFGTSLRDVNAQPNIFHRDFLATWQDPPHDFSLDLFALVMARRQGLTLKRFPVRFGERAHGTSHWNVDWRSKVKFIRRTVDFSFELRRRPDMRGTPPPTETPGP